MEQEAKKAYIVFIEDKEHLLWQLELFLFSITRRAGIKQEDIFLFWAYPEYYTNLDTTQDPAKVEKSDWLQGIIQVYPGMKKFYSQNFGRQNRCFRFMGEDKGFYGVEYVGINKWSSWIEWANGGLFKDYDEIFILEQDLWFSGKYPEFEGRNVVSYNWIPKRKDSFYREVDSDTELDDWAKLRGFTTWEHEGWDLDEIMTLTKVPKRQQSLWSQGAVLFKYCVEDLTPKFLNDLMNYQYLLLHMGEIAHPVGKIHETDMIAPTLAACNNNIKMTVSHDKQLATETWCSHEKYEDDNLPDNTIVHYGWTFKNYPFLAIDEKNPLQFGKSEYPDTPPWQDNRDKLKEDMDKCRYQWTKNFFQDMLDIHKEYPGILRKCNKEVGKIRV